jgi:DNA repair exonuclease SbcCD ATPase subunit
MAEETPSDFDYRNDEQDAETFYHEEIKDLRVEKLSQRVTLISIILPCLIGVAIYFGYRDVTGRVTQSQDTGSLEVQKLSRKIDDLSRKFNERLITFSTTLSAQDKDFDTAITGKMKTINDNFNVLYNDLKSLNADLKQTKSTIGKLNQSKADKKSQETAIKELNASKLDKKSYEDALAKIYAAIEPLNAELQTLADLRRDLSSVSAEIKNLESKLNGEIAEIAAKTEQARKNDDELQAAITKVSGEKIDKATLDLEVFKLRKNFQSVISQAVSGINQKLDSIQKKIEEMQISSRSSKRSMKAISKSAAAAGTEANTSESDSATPPSKSGKIDEQDLPE